MARHRRPLFRGIEIANEIPKSVARLDPIIIGIHASSLSFDGDFCNTILTQSGHARAICPFEDQGHRSFVSARRPAPVIRMRVTSIRRPPATMRSILAIASQR